MSREEELERVCQGLYEWFRYGSLRNVLKEHREDTLLCGFDTHQEQLIKVLGKKN